MRPLARGPAIIVAAVLVAGCNPSPRTPPSSPVPSKAVANAATVWALVLQFDSHGVVLKSAKAVGGNVTVFEAEDRLAAVRAGVTNWMEYTLHSSAGQTIGAGGFEVPLFAVAESPERAEGPTIGRTNTQLAILGVPYSAALAYVEIRQVLPGDGDPAHWRRIPVGRVELPR